MTRNTDSEAVRQKVREGYGKIAESGGSCCGPSPTCCGSTPVASEELAKHIGYTPEELAAIPEGANMGLSCGNPNALAVLQPGEVCWTWARGEDSTCSSPGAKSERLGGP